MASNHNYDLLVHFTFGSLLGIAELAEHGDITSQYAVDRLVAIVKEYRASRGIAVAADALKFKKEIDSV